MSVSAQRRLWASSIFFCALILITALLRGTSSRPVALSLRLSRHDVIIYAISAVATAAWNRRPWADWIAARSAAIPILGNVVLASMVVAFTGGAASDTWPLYYLALIPSALENQVSLSWASLASLVGYLLATGFAANPDLPLLVGAVTRLAGLAISAEILQVVLSTERQRRARAERYEAALSKTNQLLEEKLAERSSKLHAFAVELIRAEEEQRARIARELHDGLGQLMTAINIEIQVLHDAAPGSLKTRIDDIRALAAQVNTEMRRIAQELRPAVLDEMGLSEAVRALVNRMTRHSGLTIDVKIDGSVDVLPADSSIACYRLVQEALNNVVRHSGAKRAQVELIRRGDHLVVSVTDDGKGIDYDLSAHDHHFGLMGLQERISAIGGQFTVARPDEGGTRIEAALPLAAP